MHREKFLQIAGRYELDQWGSYVRNREARTEEGLNELFQEYWDKPWTAPNLKKYFRADEVSVQRGEVVYQDDNITLVLHKNDEGVEDDGA